MNNWCKSLLNLNKGWNVNIYNKEKIKKEYINALKKFILFKWLEIKIEENYIIF